MRKKLIAGRDHRIHPARGQALAAGTVCLGLVSLGILVYAVCASSYASPSDSLLATGGGDARPPSLLETDIPCPSRSTSLTSMAPAHPPSPGTEGYLFLPNRRTVWVINKKAGRFANYSFRDDQDKTVMRSRVITLDPRAFPPGYTDYLLSDRNHSEILWVCNRRSGDVQLWELRGDGNVSPGALLSKALTTAGGRLGAASASGDYMFLANRRTIWVINQREGSFTYYHFRDNQQKLVTPSRTVTLNPDDFPPKDTRFMLSDLNLVELLWVCNTRTGDVQLWQPKANTELVSDGQIVTSIDLMPRSKPKL